MDCIKTTKSRGAALGMVLVFMTLMLILGAGLIALAEHSAMQSSAAASAGRHYYSAESAAQLAAQMLLEEFDQSYFYKITTDIPYNPDLDNFKNEFEAETRENLQRLYTENVMPFVTGIKYNNEYAYLHDELSFDEITIKGYSALTRDASGYESYTVAVYLADPVFSVTARSAGRNVTIRTSIITNLEFTVNATETEEFSFGAYFKDETGGIYGEESNEERYNQYINGLNALLADADTNYATYGRANGVIPNPFPVGRASYNWNNAVNARYVNTWDTVVLGKDGETTVYPNLEYIRAENRLEVRGVVYTPSLIAIESVGASFAGELHAPRLENVYTGGGNITIPAGGKINPMEVDSFGNVIDLNKPYSGGVNIYGDQVLTINCDAEINWCRFNMRNIGVEYGSGGKLTSNSIFISRSWLNTSGTASSDITRVIPQFYMRGYINLTSSLSTIAGIFMTPQDGDTDYVCNHGNGMPSGTKFIGLFIGNYNQHWVPSLGGSGPIEAEIQGFRPEELSIIMDGGWINSFMGDGSGGGSGGAGIIEVDINFESSFKELSVGETTGGTP